MRNHAFALLVAATLATVVFAEEEPTGPRPPTPQIRVTATGKASGAPDEADVHIGVVSRAATAAEAAEENAGRVERVLAAVRKRLGEKADVKTVGYTVTPEFTYRENEPPKPSGYSASNLVRVRTADLPGVGKVIDAAMGAGANQVQSLEFRVKDEAALRAEALRQAVTRGRAEAEAIASTLDVEVKRVLSVEVGPPEVRVPMGRMLGMAAPEAMSAPATPIEAGKIEIDAQVTLTFEIGPRP
ncbi:MAG: uncharacterized protein QOD06_2109 [Candidatus Binatota bacterium]|jgi:uncharacterized protein YggE|nr:uncharacterized protein [Candidatus Binatota bacterium]